MTQHLYNIPPELRTYPQWVLWRYYRQQHRAKPAKLPCTLAGAAARTDNPATWTSFDAVRAAYNADRGRTFAGIGFVFSRSDPFVGVDLDNCISADGEELPWGLEFLAALKSYAEISPSGRGVKLIVRGRLGGEHPHQGTRVGGFGPDGAGAVELYEWGRFFALTGDRHADALPTIADRSAAVAQTYAAMRARQRGGTAARPPGPPAAVPTRQPNAADVADADRERRCRALLMLCPDSISGQGGHARFYRAACETVRFDLSDAAAWRVMRWWSESKSGGEPWSDREIDHKLRQARKFIAADRGRRLREPAARSRLG
jgi:hypothetical protein